MWSAPPPLLPRARPPQTIARPRTIPVLFAPPGILPQSPGSASAPSHAKLPLSVGAAEDTYGPQSRLGAHLPCVPQPRNRHRGVERAMPSQEPGSGRLGALEVARPPHCRTLGHPSPGEGGSRDGAGQSRTQSWGGKFVKKVLNTDFPGYQKENLCIAFEFNFSIKAFSL